jgi:hypothetical protein
MSPVPIDDETKAALRQNYDRIANEPGTWLFVADNLALSAHLLEPYFTPDLTQESDYERIRMTARVEGPILMLRGCGLECLLKALYVARGNKLGDDGRYVSPGGRHHDLVALAQKASFEISPSDEALLAHLGHFIMQGRYPMMQKAPEVYQTLADGSRRTRKWTGQDERDYHSLRTRLREEAVRVAKGDDAVEQGVEADEAW